MKTNFNDGEVVGLDRDGCLVLWNADSKRAENCGETVLEFGLDNLTNEEKSRLYTAFHCGE